MPAKTYKTYTLVLWSLLEAALAAQCMPLLCLDAGVVPVGNVLKARGVGWSCGSAS